jgi:hypothetical protein
MDLTATQRRLTVSRLLPVLLGGLLLAGCFGSRVDVAPDYRFGHRTEDRDARGRQVMAVSPPPADADVLVYPIVVDSLRIRVEPPVPQQPVQPRRVDVLVTSFFPDTCYRLNEVRQERIGNLIDVRLTMWRTRGATCALVVRPFRFYFELDEPLEPGAFTLRLNGEPFPFEVRRPDL